MATRHMVHLFESNMLTLHYFIESESVDCAINLLSVFKIIHVNLTSVFLEHTY